MPVITLLTDFGTADSYVAEMKGVLLSHAPGITLVDLSHQVPAGGIRTAAYLLGRTWHRFPGGSVHLVVVDPGVGTARPALAVHTGGHFFVAPDNGVLDPVAARDDLQAFRLPVAPDVSATFHGRDVFAPAAALLATGASLQSVGTRMAGTLERLTPREHEPGTGEVVHIDRFGNLVTDLVPDPDNPDGLIWLEGHLIGPVKSTFADVRPGERLAYLGSGGTLEIAVRDGSAARVLGAAVGSAVRNIDRAAAGGGVVED